ncbi:MAG: NAD+ synthase [Elusimicrobia bacterium]|nr:NAD+ synthase [Elusimicrobiota bacterium]
MKVKAVQLNSKIADFEGNFSKALGFYLSNKEKCDLTVFPELSVCGYPPLDLLENQSFIKACEKAALKWAAMTKEGPACIFGSPMPNPDKKGKRILNCAVFAEKGKIKKIVGKTLLPTYDIFDEARYFQPWQGNRTLFYKGKKIAITVCEDIWANTDLLPHCELYEKNPLKECADLKPDLVVNISASPFHKHKGNIRKKILSQLSKKYSVNLAYVNCCGANDELIFDGESLFFSKKGELLAAGEPFEENSFLCDFDRANFPLKIQRDCSEDIKKALVCGIRDYFYKQGFSKAVLGLSGGIDSAVVACLAAEALGKENVLGVLMPSPYTSQRSIKDALLLGRNLGIKTEIKKISGIYSSFIKELGYGDSKIDLAKQNLQSRIRGAVLMAYSNRSGYLVLTTGNKSEIAMGYCTLYGDTAGAIAPIGDLLKTEVYELAEIINKDAKYIPQSIISRPPSAELKPRQKDQDDLPPYNLLDRIIKSYMEEGSDLKDFQSNLKSFAEEIIKRMENNEYKRKQLPMCLKISKKSFGTGRKMPSAKSSPPYR